ncbi:MAG: ribosomal protein S18-alanine N-acetyltransferase [Legionellaceae bacterium]|nr:ribosomal protein S18-alanine N-acetyltransferase [Legionellaceae bacterium]
MKSCIRAMELRDLCQIFSIEQIANTTPWSEKIFYHCMLVGYECLTIEVVRDQNKTIAGYCISRLKNDKAHILNLTIAPSFQGRGLGKALLQYVLDGFMKLSSVRKVVLEVRISNTRAIQLYQQQGFYQSAQKKAYYNDKNGSEDALVLEKNLHGGRNVTT